MHRLLLIIPPVHGPEWDTRDAVIAASPGAAAACFDRFGAAIADWRGWLGADVVRPAPGAWIWEGELALVGATPHDEEVVVGGHAWRKARHELLLVALGHCPFTPPAAASVFPEPTTAVEALKDGADAQRYGGRRREPPGLPRHLVPVWVAGWDSAARGELGTVLPFPGRVLDLPISPGRSS